jgi:hypothetical protein
MNPGTTHSLAKRFAVIVLVAGGVVASGAMLAVMLSLSAQVTLAVFPRLIGVVHSPAAASPAAAASAAAVSMSDAGTTVGNAMTAIGTAVAAVALILSVGTTWFALRLKDMEAMTLKLEAADTLYEQRLAEMSAALSRNELDRANREEVRQLLLDALFALRKWVDRNGAAVTRYSVLADLSAHLEMLMSQSTEQRQRSYAELTKFLPKAPTTDLAPIDTYAKRCHRLHGGTDHMHGVWCDIFSAIEREAYVKARAQNRPFY